VEVGVGSDFGILQRQQSDAQLAEVLAPNVGFLAVADGFGVLGKGVPTASLALTTIRDYLRRRQRHGAFGARQATPGHLRALLLAALDHANARLFTLSGSNEDFVASGTSVTAVLVVGYQAYVAHVGDARAYLSRLGRVEALTADDAIFSDDALTGSGASVPAKPLTRGLLWRSLGTQHKLEVSIANVELLAGDELVLCTDGVHRRIETDEIGEILERSSSASEAVARMFALTKGRGNVDNGTIVVGRQLLSNMAPAPHPGIFDRLRGTVALVILAVMAISFAVYVYRFGLVPH
jgi:serine/threonine protein phosphatase PrpC